MNWLIRKYEDIHKMIKFGFQRMFRGYDDSAYWGLDDYLTDIILPVLKEYRGGVKEGYPAFFETPEEWDVIMDKMIDAFQIMKEDDYILDEEKEAKVREGLELFGKYFRNLWS